MTTKYDNAARNTTNHADSSYSPPTIADATSRMILLPRDEEEGGEGRGGDLGTTGRPPPLASSSDDGAPPFADDEDGVGGGGGQGGLIRRRRISPDDAITIFVGRWNGAIVSSRKKNWPWSRHQSGNELG